MITSGTRSVVLTIVVLISASAFSAATLDIRDGIGHRTGDVWIPVELSADSDVAGVNMRIEFDPDILAFDTVLPQRPPIGSEHLVLWHSPNPGELNVAAYAPDAPSALRERSATLLILIFHIKDDVPDDVTSTNITFAPGLAGSPSLPGSGMSDSAGNSISHSATGGSVQIETASETWNEYE